MGSTRPRILSVPRAVSTGSLALLLPFAALRLCGKDFLHHRVHRENHPFYPFHPCWSASFFHSALRNPHSAFVPVSPRPKLVPRLRGPRNSLSSMNLSPNLRLSHDFPKHFSFCGSL